MRIGSDGIRSDFALRRPDSHPHPHTQIIADYGAWAHTVIKPHSGHFLVHGQLSYLILNFINISIIESLYKQYFLNTPSEIMRCGAVKHQCKLPAMKPLRSPAKRVVSRCVTASVITIARFAGTVDILIQSTVDTALLPDGPEFFRSGLPLFMGRLFQWWTLFPV